MNSGYKTIGEYFEEIIERKFGIPYAKLFSGEMPKKPTVTVQKRTYTDPKGNVAAAITDQAGRTRYYINNVEKEYLPAQIDEILSNTEPELIVTELETTKVTVGEPIVLGTAYPEINLCLRSDKALEIVADLAGVDPSNVGISYANDYLKIVVLPDVTADTLERLPLIEGVKKITKASEKRIYVDPSKFDIQNLNFKQTNGLLEIVIPATVSQETPTLTFKALNVPNSTSAPVAEDKKKRKPKADKEKPEEANQ